MKKFDKCPCGSGVKFNDCCGGILAGHRKAKTAEELMRSRYVAYVTKNVDYLVRTTHPDAREEGLADSIRKWMRQVEWLKLHVIAATEDRVEFVAEYITSAARPPPRMLRLRKSRWRMVLSGRGNGVAAALRAAFVQCARVFLRGLYRSAE